MSSTTISVLKGIICTPIVPSSSIRRIVRPGAPRSISTAKEPHGARLFRAQRALLAGRVSLRRAAAGCHPRHPRPIGPHIVCEIAAAMRAGPGLGRQVHLILENNPIKRTIWSATRRAAAARHRAMERRRASRTARAAERRSGRLLRRLCGPAAEACLGRALAEGFAYQGEHSTFRGRPRGEPSAQLPPAAFVGFLQNHDMVGNRAFGERIDSFADPRLSRAAYACLLLSPLDAHAVHGRGVRRLLAVPVLSATLVPISPRLSRPGAATSSDASHRSPRRTPWQGSPTRTTHRRLPPPSSTGPSDTDPGIGTVWY